MEISTTERVEVKKVVDGRCSIEEDVAINDIPLKIRIGGREGRENSRSITPSFIDEFIVGHLLSEGFISGVDDILKVEKILKDEIFVDVEIAKVDSPLKEIKSECKLKTEDIEYFLSKLDEEGTFQGYGRHAYRRAF